MRPIYSDRGRVCLLARGNRQTRASRTAGNTHTTLSGTAYVLRGYPFTDTQCESTFTNLGIMNVLLRPLASRIRSVTRVQFAGKTIHGIVFKVSSRQNALFGNCKRTASTCGAVRYRPDKKTVRYAFIGKTLTPFLRRSGIFCLAGRVGVGQAA